MTALADVPALMSAETHAVALRPEYRLISTSENLAWRGLHADVYQEVPNESRYPGMPVELLIYHLRQPCTVSRHLGFHSEVVRTTPRLFTFLPSGTASGWRVEGAPEVLHIHIRRSVIDRFIQEVYGIDADHVTILPRLGVVDPLLEQLALVVMHKMQAPAFGHGLYVDCLTQTMAAHLVQHHSTRTKPPRAPKPDGLTDHRLRRLVDYIEANLDGDLSMEALADEAGLSPLYLAKAFRRAFGEPPHRYLVQRRVERAKELLRSTSEPLATIALTCGFADQSHLSSTFKRLVGVTPAAYRKPV